MISKKWLAGVAGIGVVAATFGFAAGFNNTVDNLSASNAAVASCDTDGVTTSWTTAYSAANGEYEVNSLTIDGIAAGCDAQTMKVTLADGTNAAVGAELTDVYADATDSGTITFTGLTGYSAEAVEGIHIVFDDTSV